MVVVEVSAESQMHALHGLLTLSMDSGGGGGPDLTTFPLAEEEDFIDFEVRLGLAMPRPHQHNQTPHPPRNHVRSHTNAGPSDDPPGRGRNLGAYSLPSRWRGV